MYIARNIMINTIMTRTMFKLDRQEQGALYRMTEPELERLVCKGALDIKQYLLSRILWTAKKYQYGQRRKESKGK